MKTIEDLKSSETYIIGVSGGPDSMALFHMCVEKKLHVVAAHMNYQIRDSAYRDMKIVEDYACDHHVPYKIRLQERACSGNFEAFAREQRYAFYAELVTEYHAAGVLLAHHMDDHIETYLMQKERGSEGSIWGIADETLIKNCCIIRPLLMYTKEEILQYCQLHQVPFGIDETNQSLDYTRNRIRHTIIDKLSYAEKKKICQQIDIENTQKQQKYMRWNIFIKNWNHTINELLELTHENLQEFLYFYLHDYHKLHISHHEIKTIQTFIEKNKDGWGRIIANKYEIYQEYGKLCLDTLEDSTYRYEFTSCVYLKTPYFTIAKTGESTEALTLYKSDYPIIIRNAEKGDMIQLRYGTKKLNRWFIDRKIPKKERKRWPVVVNQEGKVILVPKIGCDIAHFSNNPTLFVLK